MSVAILRCCARCWASRSQGSWPGRSTLASSTYFTTIDAAFKDDPWPAVGRLGSGPMDVSIGFDSRVTVNGQSGSGFSAAAGVGLQLLPPAAPNQRLPSGAVRSIPAAGGQTRAKSLGRLREPEPRCSGWWEVRAEKNHGEARVQPTIVHVGLEQPSASASRRW